MKLNEEMAYFGLHFQRDKVCNDEKDIATGREGMVAEAGGCLVTSNPHTESRELTGNGDNCSNLKANGGTLHIQTMIDGRVSEWVVIWMNGEWWVNQQFGGRDV